MIMLNRVLRDDFQDDRERVEALNKLNLDLEELEFEFKPLMELLAKSSGMSVSFINILDQASQWSAVRYGSEIVHTPIEDSVCQYTVLQDEPLEIMNLSRDLRFKDKDYVKDEPNLNYYYGVPLRVNNDTAIGSLCVLHEGSRPLSTLHKEMIGLVAAQVVRRLQSLGHRVGLEAKLKAHKATLRNINHDSRNQLSIIISSADLLREINEVTDEMQLELFKAINQSSVTVLEMLTDYTESLKKEAIYKPVTGNELKRRLKKYYGGQASTKGIQLEFHVLEGDVDFSMPVVKVMQAIGNAMMNAIKFTRPEGFINVKIRPKTLKGLRVPTYLEIQVSDSGIGMSSEDLESVRNGMLPRLREGTKGEPTHGLGLRIIQESLNEANGTMTIDSLEGVGTTIKFEFPCEVVGDYIPEED